MLCIFKIHQKQVGRHHSQETDDENHMENRQLPKIRMTAPYKLVGSCGLGFRNLLYTDTYLGILRSPSEGSTKYTWGGHLSGLEDYHTERFHSANAAELPLVSKICKQKEAQEGASTITHLIDYAHP